MSRAISQEDVARAATPIKGRLTQSQSTDIRWVQIGRWLDVQYKSINVEALPGTALNTMGRHYLFLTILTQIIADNTKYFDDLSPRSWVQILPDKEISNARILYDVLVHFDDEQSHEKIYFNVIYELTFSDNGDKQTLCFVPEKTGKTGKNIPIRFIMDPTTSSDLTYNMERGSYVSLLNSTSDNIVKGKSSKVWNIAGPIYVRDQIEAKSKNMIKELGLKMDNTNLSGIDFMKLADIKDWMDTWGFPIVIKVEDVDLLLKSFIVAFDAKGNAISYGEILDRVSVAPSSGVASSSGATVIKIDEDVKKASTSVNLAAQNPTPANVSKALRDSKKVDTDVKTEVTTLVSQARAATSESNRKVEQLQAILSSLSITTDPVSFNEVLNAIQGWLPIKEQLATFQSQLALTTAEKERISARETSLNDEVAKLRKNLLKQSDEITSLNDSIRQYETKFVETSAELNRANSETFTAREASKSLTSKVGELKRQLASVGAMSKTVTTIADASKNTAEIEQLRSNIAELERQSTNWSQVASQAEAQAKKSQTELDSLQSKYNLASSQLQKRETELKQVTLKLSRANQDLNSTRVELKEVKSSIATQSATVYRTAILNEQAEQDVARVASDPSIAPFVVEAFEAGSSAVELKQEADDKIKLATVIDEDNAQLQAEIAEKLPYEVAVAPLAESDWMSVDMLTRHGMRLDLAQQVSQLLRV